MGEPAAMTPPRPPSPAEPVCSAHAALVAGIDDLKGSTKAIQETLTDLRIQLARDLGSYEQSTKGAWKEIRELRADLRRAGRDDEPTAVRELRDREDALRGRRREREDGARTSIAPGGSVFKIPVPKVIIWIAIAIGFAIAAGGWAWGVFNDSRATSSEERQPSRQDDRNDRDKRVDRALDAARALAPHLQDPSPTTSSNP